MTTTANPYSNAFTAEDKRFNIYVNGRLEGVGTAEQVAAISLYFMKHRVLTQLIEIKEAG